MHIAVTVKELRVPSSVDKNAPATKEVELPITTCLNASRSRSLSDPQCKYSANVKADNSSISRQSPTSIQAGTLQIYSTISGTEDEGNEGDDT